MGFTLFAALACLFSSALLTLSVIDARTREIPPGISLFVLILGLIAALIDLQNWQTHLIGFFAISLPLYLIFQITQGKGIGGGDIKLMAGCGLFLGWKLIVLGFFLGCAFATVIHLTLMALRKADRSLSFGPYLSLGIFAAMLFGHAFIDWYLHLFI